MKFFTPDIVSFNFLLALVAITGFSSSKALLERNDDAGAKNDFLEPNPSHPASFGRQDYKGVRGLQSRNSDDNSLPVSPASERERSLMKILAFCVFGVTFLFFVLHCCKRRAVLRRLLQLEEDLRRSAGLNETRQRGSGVNTSRMARNLIDVILFSSSDPLGSVNDSNSNNNVDIEQIDEESLTRRREYNAERKARILQLFAPVRTILLSHNFPNTERTRFDPKTASVCTNSGAVCSSKEISIKSVVNAVCNDDDIPERPEQPQSDVHEENEILDDTCSIIYDEEDEENMVIEIPVPGLIQAYHVTQGTKDAFHQASQDVTMRLASGICHICLSAFKVGSNVVWSSNTACKHVFHEKCIEKWLMNQHEEPLCPCCRRDFIIDPYDMEVQEVIESGQSESPSTLQTENLEQSCSDYGDDIPVEILQESPNEIRSSSPTTGLNIDTTDTQQSVSR